MQRTIPKSVLTTANGTGHCIPPTACKSQTTTSPVTTMPKDIVPDETPSPDDLQGLYGLAQATKKFIDQGTPPALAVFVNPKTGKTYCTTPAQLEGGAAPDQRTIDALIKTININDPNSTARLQQRSNDQEERSADVRDNRNPKA